MSKPTLAEVEDAERRSAIRRFSFLPMLRINEQIASPAQLALYAEIKASKDAKTLDAFLSRKDVNDLFCHRVLFYGDSRP